MKFTTELIRKAYVPPKTLMSETAEKTGGFQSGNGNMQMFIIIAHPLDALGNTRHTGYSVSALQFDGNNIKQY